MGVGPGHAAGLVAAPVLAARLASSSASFNRVVSLSSGISSLLVLVLGLAAPSVPARYGIGPVWADFQVLNTRPAAGIH